MAPVLGLLFHGCPAAIFGRIRAIIISAFNRVGIGRLLPHISEEIRERFPPFTDRNATAAIVGVRHMTGVCASLKHGLPGAELGCPSMSVSSSMRGDSLDLKTPAGQMLAACQIAGLGAGPSAALADAQPNAFLSAPLAEAYNAQAAKRLANKVERFHSQNIPAIAQ